MSSDFIWLFLLCYVHVRVADAFDGGGRVSSPSETASFGSSEDDTFPVPIFPLRKQVRLPGDTLTLNLYEDRYLSMAERILQSNQRAFGALYCSNKPQIIKAGEGPIVPLVSPGDVGVICKVIFDEDSMVETATDGFRRRRIKLDAVAVGRFSIHRVLHNGYDKHDSAPPYILASVRRINDVSPPSSNAADEQLEQTLLSVIKGTRNQNDAFLQRSFFASGYHQAMKGKKRTASEEAYFEWGSNEGVLDENQRRQMLSFAAAASLERKLPGNDLEWLLLTRSTADRLSFILDALREEQQLGPLKKFFEIFWSNASGSMDEAL